MARIAQDRRYSTVAIWFHWTIAALVIVNIVIGLLHDPVPVFRALMPAHFAIGLTVLLLTVGRVAWRLTHKPPPLPTGVRAWERVASSLTQGVLYLLLLVMPMSGWAMMSGGDHARAVSWFGLFTVPKLPVPAQAAASAHATHVLLGWVMAALVALHVAAALRHQLILRDAVMRRMVPARNPTEGVTGTA